MIIQCDRCATRYRLDESRVTGYGVKVRCTGCQNVFIVTLEEARIVEEVPNPEKGKATAEKKEETLPGKPAETAAKKALDNETLEFNFDRPPEDHTAPSTKVEGPAPETSSGAPAPEKEKGSRARPEAMHPGLKSSFEDLDFSFGDGEEAEGPAGEWKIDAGIKETAPDELKAHKPAEPLLAKAPRGPETAPDVKEPNKPPAGNAKDGANFEEVLSSITDGGGRGHDEATVASPPAGRPAIKYYAAAGAIALIAATAFYLTGGADRAAGRFFTRSSTAPREAPVRIDTIKGYFADNRLIGRVFVIEASIKNISDSPQEIKEIRGALYNGGGERIKVQAVSAGRVVSMEDIKNLSKDDILKQYSNVSGGTIPAKGTVPVTVVFTDVPKGMSEYGIDIVRGPS